MTDTSDFRSGSRWEPEPSPGLVPAPAAVRDDHRPRRRPASRLLVLLLSVLTLGAATGGVALIREHGQVSDPGGTGPTRNLGDHARGDGSGDGGRGDTLHQHGQRPGRAGAGTGGNQAPVKPVGLG